MDSFFSKIITKEKQINISGRRKKLQLDVVYVHQTQWMEIVPSAILECAGFQRSITFKSSHVSAFRWTVIY